LAVEAGRLRGIFPDEEFTWEVIDDKKVDVAKSDVDEKLSAWRDELKKCSKLSDESNLDIKVDEHISRVKVVPVSELLISQKEGGCVDEETERISATDAKFLNEEQRRAYDIVDQHLQETMKGGNPSQLLMAIPGEGGVGKSKLIQTMTKNFENHNVSNWWVKGAYTGIAASLIDGKTLHVLDGIPVKGGKQSAQTKKRLHEFWREK
jgi:hypothetical protein